ncbi:MAG: anti-sigma factor [Verrucomicrobiota bacterium]
MNCDEALRLLDAYHDGELDLAHALEIEQHVNACEKCARALQNLRVLSESLATAAYPSPDNLRETVLPKLQTRSIERPRRAFDPMTALALAAAVLFGFFLAQILARHSVETNLLATLTDNHIRSLTGTHLTDVVSSDQHTVRPWFEGKIDFAPPVEDLSAQGFPLVGGRLELISGRSVAALVYERRKHFINLFIWPNDKSEAIAAKTPQRGYNVVHWARNGMGYWAVSEIAADELQKFADVFNSDR